MGRRQCDDLTGMNVGQVSVEQQFNSMNKLNEKGLVHQDAACLVINAAEFVQRARVSWKTETGKVLESGHSSSDQNASRAAHLLGRPKPQAVWNPERTFTMSCSLFQRMAAVAMACCLDRSVPVNAFVRSPSVASLSSREVSRGVTSASSVMMSSGVGSKPGPRTREEERKRTPKEFAGEWTSLSGSHATLIAMKK